MEIGPCHDMLVPDFSSDYCSPILPNQLSRWSDIFSRQRDRFAAQKAGSPHCGWTEQRQNEAPSAADTSVHQNHPAAIQMARVSETLY